MSEQPTYPDLGRGPHHPRDVIISPVNLTANGRAHLGHAGGPFLRTDVLRRALRRGGHRVWSGLTTDSFENHVVAKAVALGVDPATMAREFHVRIRADLAALDIRFDSFDDPVQPENIDEFYAAKTGLMTALERSERAQLRAERLPIDDSLPASAPVEDRLAIGAWFSARCPICSKDAGSFFCEACGAHFEPEETKECGSRRGKIVDWIDNKSYFLQMPGDGGLPRLWDAMRVEAPFTKVAQHYLDQKGATMRLTLPGRYGIPWSADEFVNQQILFSYSASCYSHHLYCGARYAQQRQSANGFSRESSAFLIGSTGSDNTVAVLVGVSGCASSQPIYRPFDRMFINFFLQLNGKKFSTSRGHVIWAGDIAAVPGIWIDALRVYLSEICPEEEEANLEVDTMIERHNSLVDTFTRTVPLAQATLASSAAAPPMSERLLATLQALYAEQCTALSIDRLRVSQSARPLHRWLELGSDLGSRSESYTWLKGLAFLGAPLMPNIAHALWRWLGHDDMPTTESLLSRPQLRMHAGVLPPPHHLTRAQLTPCLPKSLTD
jgi:methionyl-tRNA synthetase